MAEAEVTINVWIKTTKEFDSNSKNELTDFEENIEGLATEYRWVDTIEAAVESIDYD